MKNKNLLFILTGFTVAGLLILLQVLFIVREGDAAVVTTFGKPTRDLTEAGPYFRWPWPIQRVYRFDQRTQCFEGPYEQILTRDGKNLLISLYVGWRIMEPTPFLERVGSMEQAERNLEGLLRNYTSATLGQHPFSALVNVHAEALRFLSIEEEIKQAVQNEAETRYGIHVEYLGIRRIGLPESITTRVFERMRAERTELSERYASEGESEALRIRAEADSEREQTLARADAEAKRIRAEGEAMAAEAYRIFAEDPKLAVFLRKLDVMQDVLTNRTTLILGTDSAPFDLLQGPLDLEP
jgi:modulator of FtsH protease HflC